jgi:peptidyl-prolyl isomerase H (cyclophilin H)
MGADPAVMEAINRGNSVVFFDMVLGGGSEEEGKALGRIKLELFVKDCPKTCENFRQFCTGEYTDPVTRAPLGYKNSSFHRVIKDFMLQGGDFINGDGSGKMCIYGTTTFQDENLTAYKHDRPGMLCMANSGPNSNGCQFYITCKNAEWLDGKHVIFGKVLDDGESMMTVKKMEAVPTKGGANQPRVPLRIVQCGEL